MAGIWVFAEGRDQTLELLGAGRDIAGKLSAKLAAFATGAELARDYIECGADIVFQIPELAKDQPLESFVPVIADLARELSPDVFLIGATCRGKEIGARLSTRLDTGLCSSCIGLKLDENGKLMMDRRGRRPDGCLYGKPSNGDCAPENVGTRSAAAGKERKDTGTSICAGLPCSDNREGPPAEGHGGYNRGQGRRLRWARFG